MKLETTYSAVLGKILAQKRKDKGWDQADVARKTGINRSSWSRLENGAAAPDAIQLAKIADAFGTTPDKLFAEVGVVQKQLEQQKIKVHMAKEVPQSGNKLGLLVLGAALGAIITALIAGKNSDDK